MRLRQTKDVDLCWTRVRSGKGFSFKDADGTTISDRDERARLTGLAIPPAWTGVAICRFQNGHVQARGTDADGRMQYIYHDEWEARRNARKTERLQVLTEAITSIRRQVEKDLSRRKGTVELAVATAVALIDNTSMRVGLEQYFKSHRTRGAATLLNRDVRVSGTKVRLSFKGKGGRRQTFEFRDKPLAGAIRRVKALRGARLLQFRNDGNITPITSVMINEYLQQVSGADISAKDLRMLHASALAGEELAGLKPASTGAGKSRQIARVARKISRILHNTPAVTRSSYIAEPILKAFGSGRLRSRWQGVSAQSVRLSAEEQHLKKFLEGPAAGHGKK